MVAVHAGMGINWLVHRWKCKPIAFFEKALQESAEGSIHLESITVLKSIYRYSSNCPIQHA